MTVYRDKDLLSKIQSSYFWTPDPVEPLDTHHNVRPKRLTDQSSLKTLLQRSDTLISQPTRAKESTAISLTEMKLRAKPRQVWTPPAQPQVPPIEDKSPSRLALLTKTGRQICHVRLLTLALSGLLIIGLLAAISIPIGIVFGIVNKITTSTSTTTLTTTLTTETTTSFTTSTSTTPPATAWIPSNFYLACSSTCINVSTVTPSTLVAAWTFEQNTNDVSGNGYNGQLVNGGSFTTGYIGQAIQLQNAFAQFVNAPFVPLNSRSFTVEGWLYLDSLSPTSDLDIFTQTESSNFSRRLHYVVRQNKLYMGFFGNDAMGTTNLTTSVWYHVAFVYDFTADIKLIYLNGITDASSTASSIGPSLGPYLGVSGNTSIGAISSAPTSMYWNGRLDQITVSNRVKTSCEILNDASLVAHFPFDNSYADIGPNSLIGTGNGQGNGGLSWVTGQVGGALQFNASISYFQTCGLWALGWDQRPQQRSFFYAVLYVAR